MEGPGNYKILSGTYEIGTFLTLSWTVSYSLLLEYIQPAKVSKEYLRFISIFFNEMLIHLKSHLNCCAFLTCVILFLVIAKRRIGFSPKDIKQHIDNSDMSELNSEFAELLLKFVPTKEEVSESAVLLLHLRSSGSHVLGFTRFCLCYITAIKDSMQPPQEKCSTLSCF